jgi:5-methyltetrahydrofolate--homocysteine methyltransferase
MEILTTTIGKDGSLVQFSPERPTVVIGERINPTGRKKMQAALVEGDFDMVRQDAIAQVSAGAAILDVNAGVPGIDETKLLQKLVLEVSAIVDVPLCIDTADPIALEAALKTYAGKALVNSVNGEKKSLDAILPLVAEHSAAVIALCMELVLSLGADSSAGRTALATTRLISEKLGVNMTMGASNISFGLPDRKSINTAFITMAIQAGVTCPITNPLIPEITAAILAADLAMGKDQYAMRWIKSFRARS